MCTSSRAALQAKVPACTSPRICFNPARIAAYSSVVSSPCSHSIVACATEPTMSSRAMRESNATDAFIACTSGCVASS